MEIYKDRSGIIISGVLDDLIVNNNCVVSAQAANLINITYFNSPITRSTDSKIFNNTLVARGQPYNVMHFNKETNAALSDLQVKNNLFYTYGNNLYPLQFQGINSSYMTSQRLNNNLYYNEYAHSGANIIITFQDGGQTWNFNGASGVITSPEFTSYANNNYTLQYSSPAINKGTLIPTITEDRDYKKRPYWVGGTDIGAYEYSEAQLRIGHESVDGQLTHTITALGTYWKKSGSSWVITNESDIGTNSYTFSQNVSSPKEAWEGFRFKWMLNLNETRPLGHAFYKISNLNTYFYLDLRDITTAYNPNIYLLFDGTDPNPKYKYITSDNISHTIDEGNVLRVWSLAGSTISQTNLPTYRDHMLINLEESNHPRLVWGPLDVAGLELQRHNGTSWSLFRTYTSGEIMDVDETVDIAIHEDEETTLIKYLLNVAECSACTTNTVEYHVTRAPEKRNAFEEKEPIFSLAQNYPNPFNPTTSISFSIPKMENVIIKLYNILGKEIQTLINANLSPGSYKIQYNGKELASGIYFYSITAGTFSEVKKMQILK